MRISVMQDELNTALKSLNGIVPSKPHMPLFAHVKIDASYTDNEITITAYDAGTSQSVPVRAKVHSAGSASAHYRTIKDLTALLSNERIDLTWNPDTYTINLRQTTNCSNIKSIDPDDFS